MLCRLHGGWEGGGGGGFGLFTFDVVETCGWNFYDPT